MSTLVLLAACKKNNEEKEDTTPPQITSVTNLSNRTDALSFCDFGDWIIIRGKGLASTYKIDFNTVLASDSLLYADDTTVTVKIPSILPDVLNNPITVFTKYGSVKYDFQIKQPLPLVQNITPSVGDPGDIITVTGLNFINLKSVKFGDQEAEIVSSTPTEIKVKVPAVPYGYITVKTSSGEMQSAGIFGFKYMIFTDALATDWIYSPYSANYTVVQAPSPVLRGNSSVKATYSAGYGGFRIKKNTAMSLTGYSSLKFSLYAESASVGKKIRIFLNNSSTTGYKDITISEANKWVTYEIPLSQFGTLATLNYIEVKEFSNVITTVIYIDDMVLM